MRFTALIPLAFLAACATQPGEPPPSLTEQVDFLLVDKSDRTLTAYRDGQVLKTYTDIALGDAPEGHKQFEGDGKTPEGHYQINRRNPNSKFHLSIGISYPNAQDRADAAALGQSPKATYLALRLSEAHRLALDTSLPVQDIALATGFASQASFARAFRAAHGRSVSALRSTAQ